MPIQPGGANPLINGPISECPNMLGWNTSALSGLSGFWANICRDVSNDNLSPYNTLFQANLGSGNTSIWYTSHQYGFPFNIVSGATPLKNITAGIALCPSTLSGIPFTSNQNVESWPVSFVVNLTSGSAIVTGTGFQSTADPNGSTWPIVSGGTYLVNGLSPYLTVLSVQSNTQLTLSGIYTSSGLTGATFTGPFNLACQLSTASQDHHQFALVIDSSGTGFPSKLYEMYGAMSVDGGNTWGESVGSPSAGLWNLVTGAQNPEFEGASSAAGLPYFPLCINYDEILQSGIFHAMPVTLGGGTSFGLGAGGNVFPAPQSNNNDNGRWQSGFVPLGGRLRLKSSFAISGFSAINQIILTAAKKYGFINVDWTSPNSTIAVGALSDSRWGNDWQALNTIPTTEFELVDTISPRFSWSGSTRVTRGVSHAWTLTQDAFSLANDSNYFCNIYVSVSNDNGANWTSLTAYSATQSTPGPFTVNYIPPSGGAYLFKIDYGGNTWLFPNNFSFLAIDPTLSFIGDGNLNISLSQIATNAFTIASSIGSSLSGVTGRSVQGHLQYAVNQDAYWTFWVNGNQLNALYSINNGTSWSIPTNSPYTLAGTSSNDGRDYGFYYGNIGSTDVLHMAEYAASPSTFLLHGRWTLGTTWTNTTPDNSPFDHGETPAASCGCFDSANYPVDLYCNDDGNQYMYEFPNTDSGSSWSYSGPNKYNVATIPNKGDCGAIFSLGSRSLLAIGSNGNVTNLQITNLIWNIYTSGSGFGIKNNIFGSDFMSTSADDWGAVARTTSDIHLVVLSDASGNYSHVRFNGSSWSAGDSVGTLTYASGSCISLITDNTSVWMAAIDTSKNIQYNKWVSGGGWGGWTVLQPTRTNTPSYITGVYSANNNKIMWVWTESTASNNNIVGSTLSLSGSGGGGGASTRFFINLIGKLHGLILGC